MLNGEEIYKPRQAINKTSHKSLGGRIWMTMLGLSLCLMGAVGCIYLYLSFQKARQCDHWIELPAKVIVSMIDDSGLTQHHDVKYRLEVHYRYEFEGKAHLSSKVKILPIASRDQNKIERWQKLYPVGKNVTCHVNPSNPAEAILKKPTKAALYSIWFPAILILLGLKMIYEHTSNIFSTKSEENH